MFHWMGGTAPGHHALHRLQDQLRGREVLDGLRVRESLYFDFTTIYLLILYSSSVFFLAAPVIAAIILNVFFLCHVIKILNSKLETENNQLGSSVPITVRSTKAVMVLIPIFGLQFLLLPIRPSKGNNQT